MLDEELAVIDTSNLDKLKELAKDESKLERIFEYSEKYLENDYIYGNILRKKDYIDKYVFDKLKSSNIDDSDREIIKNYLSILYKYTKLNPTLIFSNPIFQLDDDYLVKLYLGEEKYNELYNLGIKTAQNGKDIYNIFMLDEDVVSESRYKFLINFLTNTIDSDSLDTKQMRQNFITKILESEKNYGDLRTKNFILKHLCNEKTEKLNLNLDLYLCDYYKKDLENSAGKCIEDTIIINAAFFRNTKINDLNFTNIYDNIPTEIDGVELSIDERFKLAKDMGLPMYKMISVLYHEIRHAEQNSSRKNNENSFKSFYSAERKILEKHYSRKEYEKNYFFEEIEIDSNISAYEQALDFFATFAPKKLELLNLGLIFERKRALKKMNYSYKKDINNNTEINELYIVENLNNIFKNDPSELEKYTMFKEIYNDDGTLKTFEQLISNKYLYRKDFKEHNIFDKYLIYYIYNDKLENIDISKYNEKSKEAIFDVIEDILVTEIKKLFDISNYYDRDINLRENIDLIIKRNFEIINKIYMFFKKNNYSNEYVNNYFMEIKDIWNRLEVELEKEINVEGELNEVKHK